MSHHQLPHEGQTALVHTLGLVPGLCFEDRVSLFIPGWPGIHCLDQAGFSNPPASSSQVLIVGYRTSHPAFDQCPARQKCSSLGLVLNACMSVHFNFFLFLNHV